MQSPIPPVSNRIKAYNRLAVYPVSFLCALLGLLLAFALKRDAAGFLFEKSAAGFYGTLRALGSGAPLSAFAEGQSVDFLSFAVNPFNRLYALVPLSSFPLGATLLSAVRCGIAAALFTAWLKKRSCSDLSSAIFGTLYALSSYSVLTLFGFASPDTLVALPLLLIGLDRLIARRGIAPLGFAVAFTVMTAYTTAFGLIVFALLAFVCLFFAEKTDGSPRGTAAFFADLGLFFAALVLGLLAASCVLFPALEHLTLSFEGVSFTQKFNLVDFLAKMLPGSFDGLSQNYLPYLYIGMMPLLLIPVYFLNGKIARRNKVVSAILLSVLYFTFSVQVISRFWDLFAEDVTVRYSLAVVFPAIFLTLSAVAFDRLSEESEKVIAAAAGTLITLVALLQKMGLTFAKENPGSTTPVKVSYFDAVDSVWIPIFFLLLSTGAALACLRQKKSEDSSHRAKTVLSLLVLLSVIADAGISNAALLKAAAKSESSAIGTATGNGEYAASYFDAYRSGFSAFVGDTELYRAEKADKYSDSDMLFLGCLSLADTDPELLSALGIGIGRDGLLSSVASPLSLSLLGVRYFATHEKLETKQTVVKKLKNEAEGEPTYDKPGEMPEGLSDLFDLVYQSDAVSVYENRAALPLVFPAASVPDGTILSDPLLSPYSRINLIFRALTGDDTVSPYREANVASLLPTYCKVSETEVEEGYTVYESKLSSGNPYLVFGIEMEEEGPLYCSFGGTKGREISAVKVNGFDVGYAYSKKTVTDRNGTAVTDPTESVVTPNSLLLGYFEKGETVEVSLTFGNSTDNKYLYLPEGQPFFFEIDDEELSRAVGILTAGLADLSCDSASVSGKTTDSSGLPYLVSTLGFDAAEINTAKSAPKIAFLGGFAAWETGVGETSFSIRPSVAGNTGFLLSCAGILLLFLFLLLEKMHEDGRVIPVFSRVLARQGDTASGQTETEDEP